MSQYNLRILNHTVMGYPYVPICKFQITSTAKSKKEKVQQSPYVNPPLYNPKLEQKDKQPVSTPSFDSAYMKQFPIEFSSLTFSQAEELEIRLIELTRTGREKQIGYSKITLNSEVLGKSTRHKIIQIGQEAKVLKEGVKHEHVISIVEVGFVVFRPKEVGDGRIVKQEGVINPYKIEESNTSSDRQSLEQDSRKSDDSEKQRKKSFDPSSQAQNQRIIFDSSREFANHRIPNDTNLSFNKPQKIIQSKDQSLSTIINQAKPQPPQQITSSRRVLHHRPSESSGESSYPMSRQSRVYSNERITGKIVRQRPGGKNVEPIVEAPVNKETEFKHKRRLKYIFSTSEFGSVPEVVVENQRTQQQPITNQPHFQKQSSPSQQNSIQRHHLKRMHTQANPTMPTSLVQYFISSDETDQNGCNVLTNLNIVYESAFGPFYPKYVTFLTYKLYESIIRINCEELKNQNEKMDDSGEEEKYLLQTEEGQLYEPEVCSKFSKLKLYLPKYCMRMRVQIIMQDESVYVGTLENQCGMHVKSVLNLKRVNTMQNAQIRRQKQRVNLTVNILQNVAPKQIANPIIQQADIALPKQNTAKNLGYQKSRFEEERFFPQIAKRLHTQQNRVEAFMDYKDYSTLHNDNRGRREISPIERTLNAINSYKNVLMPQRNETQVSIDNVSPPQFGNQMQKSNPHANSYDRYLALKKDIYSKTREMLLNDTRGQNTLDPQYHPTSQQPTQQEIAQLLTSKRKYHKDLPKIIVQRSSKHNLNDARKQTLINNLQTELAIKTRKKNKTNQQQDELSRERFRMDFFRKVLSNKYGEYLQGNREFERKYMGMEKRTGKSRSRVGVEEQAKEERRRQKKLMKLPYKDFSYTKIFPSHLNRSSIKMASCHEKCVQPVPMTKQLKEKKKKHLKSNGSLKSLDDRTKSEFKKGGNRFNIVIKRIDYLKLIEQGSEIKGVTKKFRSPGEDSENQRWEESQQQKKEEELEVFLKLYNESKKQTQLVTPSQKLGHAFSNDSSPSLKLLSPSQKSLNYLTTSWLFKQNQFVFKNIKTSDMITVEAYGDLSTVDNHQFLGRCIFTVQEMGYMRIQKKITGYLVRNKKIESHCTVHFEIEEVL